MRLPASRPAPVGVLLLAALAAAPASGQPAAEDDYAACMALARSEPDAALDRAEAWWKRSNAEGARHCAAVALIAKGRYPQGARVLTDLAGDLPEGETATRGALLGQAGQAWLMAGDPARAIDSFTGALAAQPEEATLYIDRAIAKGAAERYWEALDDLNRAIELAPDRAEAWLFRATAWRKLDSLELARDNVTQALELSPGSAEAWLERGIIARLRGNPETARQAWRKAAALDPEGPVGRAARDNLTRLDRGAGAAPHSSSGRSR